MEGLSDAFGKRGREIVLELSSKLPAHTQQALQHVLDQLDHVTENLKAIEAEMIKVFAPCLESTRRQELRRVRACTPAVAVIGPRSGSIERFGRAEQLASYSGLVAREHSSRWQIPLWPGASRCQRVFRVGFCRGCE